MIKIGIISNSCSEIEFVQEIQKLKEFKITGLLNALTDIKGQPYSLGELLDSSEALYIDKLEVPGTESLKSFLRKSTHIFLKNPFISSLSSIRQLASFQQEAGSIIQIYNPYVFHPEILSMKDKLETPLFLDMELTIDTETKLEQELLKTLLLFSGTEKSDFRKLEVFGLQGKEQSLLNLHIQFVSGSIAQLKVYTQKDNPRSCRINIYQKESAPVQLQIKSTFSIDEKSKQNALNHFMKGINDQDATLLSLNELDQSITALQEIKEKLKYPNIQL